MVNHKKHLTSFMVLAACIIFASCAPPAYSQSIECIKTKINPLPSNPLPVPETPGSTNNDKTYENIDQFADLDISPSILSTCIYKNAAARLINFDPVSGSLKLLDNLALTDPVNQNQPASIRGVCKFNNNGDLLFFPGNGPQEFGFDRIYSYNVSTTNISKKGSFIPSDLTTSLTVTPNGKYLVYLQANTLKNNLASIQSVEIKPDKTLSKSLVGQDIANVVSAGSFIEFANGLQNDQYSVGVFSNLEQGKAGSGNSFAIFKTNQTNGTNIILAEFKKDDPNFGGFSGFKLIQRNSNFYLFISYFDIDPNAGFPGFSYITKIALFKINIEDNKATLTPEGEPTVTVFKTEPCNLSNYHGISGPVWVTDSFLYLADSNLNQDISKNENYFAAYFIDWNLVGGIKPGQKIIRLASVPVRTNIITGERNTDLVIAQNNKFAFLITSNKNEPSNAKIFGYLLEKLNTKCSTLIDELSKDGICELDQDIKLSLDNDSTPSINKEPKVISTDKGLELPKEKPSGKLSTTAPNQNENTLPVNPENALTAPANIQPPPFLQPMPPLNSGRPPAFGANYGRPMEFGAQPFQKQTIQIKNKQPITLKPPSVYRDIKPQFQYENNKTQEATQSPDTSVKLEAIESEIKLITSKRSQSIDIKSLDLKGEDQIIISPKIPKIILNVPSLTQTASISILSLSSETRGAIKLGSAAYIIYLKDSVKLQSKDLKNITFAVIDSEKKITTVPGAANNILSNKLLAKLSFPSTVPNKTLTLLTILNKAGGKKDIISKSQIQIFNPLDFENFGNQLNDISIPRITSIQGKVVGTSIRGGKIIRLTITGDNFASKLIKIKGKSFLTQKNKTHTLISFIDESNIEVLRARVLSKGRKMLVTIRFKGNDIDSSPFTISTPKGQLYKESLGTKLFAQKPIKTITKK